MVGALGVATKAVRPYHVHLGIPAVPKIVKPNAAHGTGGCLGGERVAGRHARPPRSESWWDASSADERAPERDAELAGARAEVSRRLADVFALQELSFVLSESLQPNRIAEQIIGYLKRFTDVGGALVALATETGGTARVAASSGSLVSLQGREIPDDDPGLLVTALRRRTDAPRRRIGRDGAGVGGRRDGIAGAVFPLRAHGVTIGALAVADPRAGGFETDTLRLLSTVATHAAIVLSNARFFDLVRTGRDQWETTFNALTEGLAVVDATDTIRRANRSLARLVGLSVPALSNRSLLDVLPYGADAFHTLLAAARRGGPVQPMAVRSDHGRTLGSPRRRSAVKAAPDSPSCSWKTSRNRRPSSHS